MPNGDDTTTDTQQPPQEQPVQPSATANTTPAEEQGVNQELFGGKQPGQYEAPKAQPVNPAQTDPGDYALQRRLELLHKDREDADKHEAVLKQHWDMIQKIQQKLGQPLPQTPQQQSYQQQPGTGQDQQQKKLDTGQMIGNVMALATIAATVFGKRHGQWGSAIQQYGIGEFLKNFAAGRHEQAQQQLSNWQKGNELIKKNNQEKVQDYKDILADRRLDLSQQMDLIKTLSYERQDYNLARAAESKDINEVVKNLDSKSKAATALTKTNVEILKAVQKSYFTNKGVRSWVDEVREKTGTNPLKDPQSLEDAEKKFPMSKWVDGANGFGEDDKNKATAGDKPHVTSAEDYNKLPSNTQFIDPDGVERVKP